MVYAKEVFARRVRMSALGHKRTFSMLAQNVRFRGQSGHPPLYANPWFPYIALCKLMDLYGRVPSPPRQPKKGFRFVPKSGHPDAGFLGSI